MDFSYFFTLSLHIIIPSAILFVVLYYSWRLTIYIKEKFTQFKRKVDGYDDANMNNRRPKKKRTFSQTTFSSNQTSNEDEQIRKESYLSLAKARIGEYSTFVCVDAKTYGEPHVFLVELDKDEQLYKIFTEKGIDYFTNWFTDQIKNYTYRDTIYVSLKSIGEQIEVVKRYLNNPFVTDLDKETYILAYAFFIELKEMETQGLLRWEQKTVDEQNYVQINERQVSQ